MPSRSKRSKSKPSKRATSLWKSLDRSWDRAIDKALRAHEKRERIPRLVHRIRVTVKQLRGILQLVRPAMEEASWQREDQALRDLNRRLAEVRTATVMEVAGNRMGVENGSAAPVLPHEVRLEDVPLETVLQELRKKRGLLTTLRPNSAGLKLIEKGIRRTYRAGREKFLAWVEDGDLETAHKCRKFTKYLMFQVELIQDQDPKRLGKLRKRLKTLEGQLGDLNDMVDFAELQQGLKSAYLVLQKQQDLNRKARKTAQRIYQHKPKSFAKKRLRSVRG